MKRGFKRDDEKLNLLQKLRYLERELNEIKMWLKRNAGGSNITGLPSVLRRAVQQNSYKEEMMRTQIQKWQW